MFHNSIDFCVVSPFTNIQIIQLVKKSQTSSH